MNRDADPCVNTEHCLGKEGMKTTSGKKVYIFGILLIN
jgi:hypothetical protein